MSAGSLVGTFVNFIMFSVIWSVFGTAIWFVLRIMNGWAMLHMDAFNTVGYLVLIYIAGPFLYALALGINYLVTANSESNAEV